MRELPRGAVTCENGEYTIDTAVLAPRLGLTLDRLKEDMRRGLVFSTSEQGDGEDAGRVRLTFRYCARAWTLVIDRDGLIREVAPPHGGGAAAVADAVRDPAPSTALKVTTARLLR